MLAVATVLVPLGNASSRAGEVPSLHVDYTMNCTFTISDDSGRRVSSIAPGTYQLEIATPAVFSAVDLSGLSDMTACKGFTRFELAGPGVNLSTTLQDGDEDKDTFKATFEPSSTYTARDLNQPTVARVVFTTTATGTPTTSPSSSSSSTSTKGTASVDIVGSAKKTASTSSTAFRGTLTAVVSAAGKLKLTFGGKVVNKLTSGRYTVKVTDQSSKAGFSLKQATKSAITLTKSSFVGTHTGSVTMKPGQWLFSGDGKSHFFLVVGGA